MLRNIKLTLEYDGTNFEGWQIQPGGHRTVQGEVETALKTIFKKNIRLLGSGRTDSGVHALGQIAHFKTSSKMPTDEIRRALNGNLFHDVSVLKAEEVKSSFHAQYSVKQKTYHYAILNRKSHGAYKNNYYYYVSYPLSIAAMRKEAKNFVGRHDFKNIMASDPHSKKEHTVRTIHDLKIKAANDFITIDVTANGFLYKMVRNIVGILVERGRGKLETGCAKAILKSSKHGLKWTTAPAQGLCLLKVTY